MAEKELTRRLAAIVVADVVGYSRLMEADEAGTFDRMRAIRTELVHQRPAASGDASLKAPAMAGWWSSRA